MADIKCKIKGVIFSLLWLLGGSISVFAVDLNWPWPTIISKPLVPKDNVMTEAKFQLGRFLFYDQKLSAQGTLACASCHEQKLAFSDGRPVSVGSNGEATARNAQSLANVAWNNSYTWANPALATLERHMEVPLLGVNPVEMGIDDHNKDEIVRRIRNVPRYLNQFRMAFPGESDPISLANIIKAIACFQRGLISIHSRYDQAQAGKIKLTPRERRGQALFFSERTKCAHCHGGVHFNTPKAELLAAYGGAHFQNTGLYNLNNRGDYPETNQGLIEITGKPSDMGKFRVPSLRNVVVTAPYLHDGSVDSLGAVIDMYAAGGRLITAGEYAGNGKDNPWKNERIAGFKLTKREKSDLLAFLHTLTDAKFLNNPRFANPWTTEP